MNVRLILTISSLLLTLPLSHADGWEKLPALPEPNGGFIAAADHGRILVIGGTNWKDGKKNWLQTVHRFDPASQKWQALPPLERPVAYAVAGQRPCLRKDAPSSTIVFAGGVDAEGMQPKIQTLEDDRFISQKAAVPVRTVLAAGGVHGKVLLMCGGAPDTVQLAKACRDTWSLDLDSLDVSAQAPHPGAPFVTAASTMDLFGKLYVFGGGTWDEKAQTVVNLDQAYAFEYRKNQWQKLRPLPFAVRGMSALSLYQESPEGGSSVKPFVYLAGGYKSDDAGFTDEAFIYDPAKDTYTPAKPLPYKAMVSLVLCDGFVYCLGGEDKKQSRTDAFFRIPARELLD